MKKTYHRAKRRLKQIFIYVVTCIILIGVLFPLYWIIISSVKSDSQLFVCPPRILPSSLTIEQFVRLIKETLFLIYFKNSVILSLSTTLVVIIIGTLGAYSVTRFKYRGRELFTRVILLCYMYPPILLVIPLFIVMRELHLINTHIGLFLVYIAINLPFALWLLRAFFVGIPLSLDESALIDGANRMSVFIHIILPLAMPGIIATAIFTFINVWNEYVFALVMLSSTHLKTLPVGVAALVGKTSVNWGMLMAAAVLISVPLLIFFSFLQKQLLHGIFSGAVKG